MRTIEGKPVFQVAFGMVLVPGGNYCKKAKKNHSNLILSLETHGFPFSIFTGIRGLPAKKGNGLQKLTNQWELVPLKPIPLWKVLVSIVMIVIAIDYFMDFHSYHFIHFYMMAIESSNTFRCVFTKLSVKRLSYSDILMFYIITTTQRVATILMFDIRFSGFWPLSFNVFINVLYYFMDGVCHNAYADNEQQQSKVTYPVCQNE